MSEQPKLLATDKELIKQLREAVLFGINADNPGNPYSIVENAIQTILEMIDAYYRSEVVTQNVKLFKLMEMVYPGLKHKKNCECSILSPLIVSCTCGWAKVAEVFAKELSLIIVLK